MQEDEFYLTDTQKAEYFDVFFGNDLSEFEWDGRILGIGACAYKPNLKKATLPNVGVICKNAFRDCKALEVVDLPCATKLGADAFYNCRSLKSVNCSLIENVGTRSFSKCSSLEEACFDEAIVIGIGAFRKCENLKKASFKNATYVGRNAFELCKNLETISLPNVRVVDEMAFASCMSLKEIELPNAIMICERAFSDCSSLRKVVLANEAGAEICGKHIFQSDWRLQEAEGEVQNQNATFGSVFVPEVMMDYYKPREAFEAFINYVKPLNELSSVS